MHHFFVRALKNSDLFWKKAFVVFFFFLQILHFLGVVVV